MRAMNIYQHFFQQEASENGALQHESAETIRDSQVIASLVEVRKIGAVDADHVLQLKGESDEPIDQILAKLGLITERELGAHYARLANVRFDEDIKSASLDEKYNDLNDEFCRARRILPVANNNDYVEAAIVDPFVEEGIAGLAYALGKEVRIIVTTSTCWQRLYSIFAHSIERGDLDEELTFDLTADSDRLKDMASEEPIVRLVSRIIAQAALSRASDIHIEPGARRALVKFRIDGVLNEEENLARGQALSVISRIKILAQLDIAERRRPQDGGFTFPVAGQPVDLRISTIPTEYGESVVVRLLDQSSVTLDYDELGYSVQTQRILQQLIAKPNGILLITGPTGSGKTTTLYTVLKQLADGKRKILTIEDPIEQRIPDISQTQANPAVGLTFATALKSFLRHDPDVIMVGEIRDTETAKMAVQAALTGHLVLSTLHTNDAVSTITRLIDMGIEDYLIASTLNGVVAQRLVRRRCLQCQDRGITEKQSCTQCRGTGFSGRIAVSEVLEMNVQLRACLRNGWLPSKISAVLKSGGFISMKRDGENKVRSGLTSKHEVTVAVGSHDS